MLRHTRVRDHRASLAALALIMLIAVGFRAWLIAADAFAFESDEAVVGLMARHITQGRGIPTFYYGQDYMGSLDALLVAGGFRLFGESVDTMRVVQLGLYALALLSGYALALTVTRRRRTALVALLLMAIPTALGTLYTGITLGGYNEVVILGNGVLLLGWQVTVGGRRDSWRWIALGLAAGLGWWTNGAIVTACGAVVLMGAWRTVWPGAGRGIPWRGMALAAVAFMIGSGPWWLHNLRHDWAALSFLTGGFEPASGVEPISPAESVIGLLVLGLPALYGLRYPWQAGLVMSAGTALAALVYLVLVTDALAGGYARLRGWRPAPGGGSDRLARRWLWLVFGVFALVFTLSSFSDATGRYLMPVWTPAVVGVALGLDRLRRAGWGVAALGLVIVLAAQAGSVITAAHDATGLTPQLVERLRTPADADDAVLDFLAAEGYTRGYASYWTSFRLVFRSHEAVILATALPYDDKGFRAGHDRYPRYTEMVNAADRVVWITQNFPELDAEIAQQLAAASITVRMRDFGPYRVYYDISRRVAPAELTDSWRVDTND